MSTFASEHDAGSNSGHRGSAVIDRDAVEAVETKLLPVPDSARESTAGHQFWIWAGANIAPINWVLGALGIQIGLSLVQTMTCWCSATSSG